MRFTGKRLVVFFAAACLILALLPAVSGPAYAADDVVYTSVGTLTQLSNALGQTGYYRLTADIESDVNLSVTAKGVVLDLAGYDVARKEGTSGNVIIIPSAGELTLEDSSGDNSGEIRGGRATVGAGVYVAGGVFTMKGGTITGNRAEGTNGSGKGGGVAVTSQTVSGVKSEGTFNFSGGRIYNNSSNGNGGGVYIWFSKMFKMDGTASIVQNTAANNGGGAFIHNNNIFQFNAGTILNNVAGDRGGGVFVNSSRGSLQMYGGAIGSNQAVNGGGVYVNAGGEAETGEPVEDPDPNEPGGVMEARDGRIYGNTATENGGGIYVNDNGTLTMSGGIVENNTAVEGGGGVYVQTLGTFRVSGSVTIQSNKSGSAGSEVENNVALYPTRTIGIIGKLQPCAIGVTLPGGTGTITSGYGTENSESDPRDFFYSDLPDYEEDYNETTQEAVLVSRVPHPHAVSVDCETDGADVVDFKKISKNYSGGSLSGLTDSEGHAVASHYYLAGDITLRQPIVITSGTVDLCLNGYAVTTNGTCGAFVVNEGAKLNICDCDSSSGTHSFNVRSDGLWVLNESGSETVSGGVITGANTSANGGGVLVNGELALYDIAVLGNRAANGGGVYVSATGSLAVYDGQIGGNLATTLGGGVYAGGAMEAGGALSMTGNMADGSNGNLYFASGKLMRVTASLEGTQAGVSMAVPGAFTQGYQSQNGDENPRSYFTADRTDNGIWITDADPELGTEAEAKVVDATPLNQCTVELSLNDENGQVVYRTEEMTQEITVTDNMTHDILQKDQDYYIVDGSSVSVDGSDPTVKVVGTYSITLHGIGRYMDEVTAEWEIINDEQPRPEGITHTDEVIRNKKDGTISGLDDTMEYKADGDDTYIGDIPDSGTVENLPAGCYQVRFKAKNNYNAGADLNVVIGDGRLLNVVYYYRDGEIDEETGVDSSTVVTVQGLQYGDHLEKPQNPTKEGYGFVGWFTDEKYTNAWDFVSDTMELETELFAKWEPNPFSVSGKVTGIERGTVQLFTGDSAFTEKEYVNSVDGGTYTFDNVVAGVYNIVIEDLDTGRFCTQLIRLSAEELPEEGQREVQLPEIEFPDENISSERPLIENGARQIRVGGLDRLAVQEAESGHLVAVTAKAVDIKEEELEAEPGEDGEEPVITLTEAEIEAIGKIQALSGSKRLDCMDITVWKTVDGVEERMTDTSPAVLEIAVPFDTVTYGSFTVYRLHEGEESAEELERISELPSVEEMRDGTFYVENGFVVIYASRFSVYAIGYTVNPSNNGYLIGIMNSGHGTVKATPSQANAGRLVTLTVEPEEGYRLQSMTVSDVKGEEVELTRTESGTYTFVMPNSRVTVRVSFVEEADYDSCPQDESCPISEFSDMSPAEWYHDGVHYCLDEGIMSGYENGRFGPNDSTTRAQLVQVLWNMEGRPEVEYELSFTDVEGSSYADAIRWAASEGIVKGYSRNTFGTNDPVTREQTVTILYRYAQSKGLEVENAAEANLQQFRDAGMISDYAKDAIDWAVGVNIMRGVSSRALSPGADVTRAEMATLIMRFRTMAA